MDGVLIGAIVATFVILVSVFVVAFRHAAEIDRERHLNIK